MGICSLLILMPQIMREHFAGNMGITPGSRPWNNTLDRESLLIKMQIGSLEYRIVIGSSI